MQDLLQIPVLNTSRLLLSFLMETSDPHLFMPDSKGGRAGRHTTVHVCVCVGVQCVMVMVITPGKIIKLVPNILKKEVVMFLCEDVTV